MSKPMTNEEYLEHGGLRCPFCRADDVGGRWPPESTPDDNLIMTIECYACGKEWTDQYKLCGYDVTDEQNEDPGFKTIEISPLYDRDGNRVYIGDRICISDPLNNDPPVEGVLKFDPAFWALAIIGDEDDKRYLLMDNLVTVLDFGEGKFGYEEIVKAENKDSTETQENHYVNS